MWLKLSGSDRFALLGIFSKQVHVSDKSKRIVGQRGVEMAAAAVAAKGYNRLRACVSASAAWVVARLTFVLLASA
jgi:hypothetical protein